MHAAEREQLILQMLEERGFIGFQELDRRLEASPATLRRDLDRRAGAGQLVRVRGGARAQRTEAPHLAGVPLHENLARHARQKEAIGRAAAALCNPGEAVIIDGGSTTLRMCPHLEDLGLQVLTNSLPIVSALLPQPNTRISIPGGALFREQNIVLSAFDEDGTGRYRASKMFLGAAAVGRHGVMQTDTLLIQAERRLLSRADQIILLVDSSKFEDPTGQVLCALEELSVLVTDDGVPDDCAQYLERAGVRLVVAPAA
ncbi:MAG: DeoR family transcriptional regulator [Phenylobacterium sp.]|nr:DeoR family transcriptional regulator [Phenylobacterium sp.]